MKYDASVTFCRILHGDPLAFSADSAASTTCSNTNPPIHFARPKKEKRKVTKPVSVNIWSQQQLIWTITIIWNTAEFFKVTISVETLVFQTFINIMDKAKWTKSRRLIYE